MNRPTNRWTRCVEARQLAHALEVIDLASEDRSELQVRRFCWWLDLTIEDRGASPAPFKQRVLDLHILREKTCIARAGTWEAIYQQSLTWCVEDLPLVAPCACDIHAAPPPDRRPRRPRLRAAESNPPTG